MSEHLSKYVGVPDKLSEPTALLTCSEGASAVILRFVFNALLYYATPGLGFIPSSGMSVITARAMLIFMIAILSFKYLSR